MYGGRPVDVHNHQRVHMLAHTLVAKASNKMLSAMQKQKNPKNSQCSLASDRDRWLVAGIVTYAPASCQALIKRQNKETWVHFCVINV